MTRRLLLAVVLTSSIFALAQSGQNASGASPAATTTGASPAATTTCAATFSSGSGHNLTKYCVTVNGNITQFSRGGDEYIQVGGPGEGYGICDLSTNTAYFDYGFNDSGNWGPASPSFNPTTAVSSRFTSDGIFQITTTVTQVAATASAPGSAKVSMKIKNWSGISRTIYLLRQADVDFLRSGTSDFTNDFDFTLDTSMGLEHGFKSGLSLTTNTFNFPYDAYTQNVPNGPNSCAPTANLAAQPFVGDGSVVQLYLIGLPSLATKTVNMTYKPI